MWPWPTPPCASARRGDRRAGRRRAGRVHAPGVRDPEAASHDLIEALMLAYIPADAVAGVLGGSGIKPVVLGALVGAPAYLNGYAAVPLVDALLAQGMAPGAAMSFVLAGGVSCIPAAVAVWALVKPRVFAAYIGIALAGSLIAGLVWGALAI